MFFFENKTADKKPIMPKAIICHGVHGPCPKKNPDILLLDEPTKAIDEVYKEELGNLLRKLSADGKTIIIVSHDLDFCGEYADRCGMFADGKLIAVNNSRDFFTSNNFYTTTVAKMSRSTIKGAVKMEDIVCYLKNV